MKILITGGAGFLGSNLAARLRKNHMVELLDNFSRPGTELNAEWLGLLVHQLDVANVGTVIDQTCDLIVHLAGQVTVTESVSDPIFDAKENILGTLSVLEAARQHNAGVIFASTNKVYGNTRLSPTYVSPVSPYGCSKAAADSYVQDYARVYGLKTLVLRNSCIYGPRQFGLEGQGWISWFVQQAILQKPITVYGDGKQVRDVLWVDDWVDLLEIIISKWPIQQRVYDVGGGETCAISVLDGLSLISQMVDVPLALRWHAARPGDQQTYISSTDVVERDFSWHPTVLPREGVGRQIEWERESISLQIPTENLTPGS